MINPLPLVLADLRRSRAGAAAVVALIGVAVALGVAVTAEERALRAGTARAADAFDLIVGARGSPAQLVLSADCRDCKTATDVEEAEVLGHGPPVIALTYRCPRCRRVVFRRYLGTWD